MAELGDRQTDECRHLLGLLEVGMGDILEGTALERHDALIAIHVDALVDGHRQMPLAEQLAGLGFAQLDRLLHRIGIEAGIAAEAVRRVEVDDDQVHGTVGLRLQDEAALELQRRADQGRQHDCLTEQAGHRRRVVVARQDGIERIRQPDDAAPAVELFESERNDHVVAGFRAIEAVVGKLQFCQFRPFRSRSTSTGSPFVRGGDFPPHRKPRIAARL